MLQNRKLVLLLKTRCGAIMKKLSSLKIFAKNFLIIQKLLCSAKFCELFFALTGLIQYAQKRSFIQKTQQPSREQQLGSAQWSECNENNIGKFLVFSNQVMMKSFIICLVMILNLCEWLIVSGFRFRLGSLVKKGLTQAWLGWKETRA